MSVLQSPPQLLKSPKFVTAAKQQIWNQQLIVNLHSIISQITKEVNEVITRQVYTKGATLTIATGVITALNTYHLIAGEGAAADDLVTINGGSEGLILVLRAASDTVTITVKDGTGNLALAGDMVLDNEQDTITLIYDADLSEWLELSRSNNGV